MSAPKATEKSYVSQIDHRTPTRGVYRRGNAYRVLTRPDGRRKVMHRFATYEEAVAFKLTTPSNQDRGGLSYVRPESAEHLRGDPCAYCGVRGEVIDHIVARRRGGSHHWSNLTAACHACNSQKGDKSLLLFLAHVNGCWEWRRAA